ncbi:hypothetical protein TNIN_461171 [Trichonephila inaurata madagascariensis]|uniref:Uncharacterized protein n=1 Tax=Trichonephila inaurata madagascariensis TaxID=2747483 RepID=A0A8X6MBD9_9ARAC|nr:hypothetical protein TNIN_461171 [Trichonephila inaurata madagascariensis]
MRSNLYPKISPQNIWQRPFQPFTSLPLQKEGEKKVVFGGPQSLHDDCFLTSRDQNIAADTIPFYQQTSHLSLEALKDPEWGLGKTFFFSLTFPGVFLVLKSYKAGVGENCVQKNAFFSRKFECLVCS